MKHINFATLNKVLFFKIWCFCFVLSAKAQKNNHTITSLINADNYLQTLIAKKGINQGFVELSEALAIDFKPGPVNLSSFYQNTENNYNLFSWQIATATIAKSGDFGITTGPYVISNKETADLFYGNYITVWRSNINDKWQLILHASIPCPKLNLVKQAKMVEPFDSKYSRLLGPKKIKMREDIVFSTDELLGKALKISGNKSLTEFYSANVALYLAGYQPLKDIDEVLPFIASQKITIQSSPTNTNRAYSGDLAYTYGKATLTIKKKPQTFSYIRIWQIQPNMKWYIIMDAYMPL
ncbi:MAG: hypothetical protein EAZ15_02995 [Sphingobacteriales bacterium]|nr:MAG: hypothetical protein EAZ15_02995 [Sphingobacteriales bacterium]